MKKNVFLKSYSAYDTLMMPLVHSFSGQGDPGAYPSAIMLELVIELNSLNRSTYDHLNVNLRACFFFFNIRCI